LENFRSLGLFVVSEQALVWITKVSIGNNGKLAVDGNLAARPHFGNSCEISARSSSTSAITQSLIVAVKFIDFPHMHSVADPIAYFSYHLTFRIAAHTVDSVL